ncbi:MAG: HEAT repeat domain-containing protein [Prochlorothrix sp.]|nr:HEAT repeat domain-containing protein [Prochlorothrix sp.]
MEFAFAIIVGLLGFGAGVGGSYALLEKRLNQQERSNQTRLNQEQAKLEQDYKERLLASTEEIKAQYETRIQQLEDQVASAAAPATPAVAPPAPSSLEQSPAPAESAPAESASTESAPAVPVAEPEPAPVAAPAAALDLVMAAAAVRPSAPGAAILDPASQVRDPEDGVRLALAETLAAAVADQPPAVALQHLPWLGQLSRDLNPGVRYAAIVGLGKLQSPKVLPFLRQGLRDSDVAVVKAASSAIDRFRSTAKAKPPKAKKAKAKLKAKNT